MPHNLFRYRCETETISAGEPIYVFEKRENSEGRPTGCITDPEHVIIKNSITLIHKERIEESVITQDNHLIISGGTITWSSLLMFDVSIAKYIINGKFYNSQKTQITLPVADVSNDRIDIIYADVNGLIGFISGIPSTTPVEPIINTLTQIKITSVTILSESIAPNTVTDVIYSEGVGSGSGEWDITEKSLTGKFNLVYDGKPFDESVSIQGLVVDTGDYISATKPSGFDTTDTNVLDINIKPGSRWFESKHLLILCYYNGAPNGNTVILKNGEFGFVSTYLDWQSLSIAKQLFNLTNNLVDELRITVNGTGDALTFQLDLISWQQGILSEVLDDISNVRTALYLDIYDSAGGVTLLGTFQDMIWDTKRILDNTGFSHTSGTSEITINQEGRFNIEPRLSTTVTAGNNISVTEWKLVINTGSGYVDVPGTLAYHQNKEVGEGEGSSSTNCVLNLNVGDKLKVQFRQSAGSNTLDTLAGASSWVIFKADAVKGNPGPTGPSGDLDWRDVWISQNYIANHAVKYLGSVYVCILNTDIIGVPGSEIPTNETYWVLIVSKGDTGAAGTDGTDGNFDWQGEWSGGTAYATNQVVKYLGSAYIANQSTSVSEDPVGTSAKWDLVAEKGDTVSTSIQDEGGNILNTPHHTLNFIGNSIQATDAGNGIANITLTVPIFGQNYQYVTSEGSSTTSSVAFVNKLTATTAILNPGTYRVAWTYNWGFNSSSNSFEAEMRIDQSSPGVGGTVPWIHTQEPQDALIVDQPVSSFIHYVNDSTDSHTFNINYRTFDGNTAVISLVRIEIWRVN
jgi:hypothetical protein